MSLYRFDKKYTVNSEIDANADKATNNENAISDLDVNKVDSVDGLFIVPDSDPLLAGALWNDSGIPKISTGA